MIRLLPGIGRQPAEQALDAARFAFQNVTGLHNQAIDRFNAYVRESNQQVRLLSGSLSSEDVGRLITTPRYWTRLGPGRWGEAFLGSLTWGDA